MSKEYVSRCLEVQNAMHILIYWINVLFGLNFLLDLQLELLPLIRLSDVSKYLADLVLQWNFYLLRNLCHYFQYVNSRSKANTLNEAIEITMILKNFYKVQQDFSCSLSHIFPICPPMNLSK